MPSKKKPSYIVPTHDVAASPGPGLAPISLTMANRINAMIELEKAPELQGRKVDYSILTPDGAAAICYEGTGEEFRAMRGIAEAYRSPRAVLLMCGMLYESCQMHGISQKILMDQLAAEYGVDVRKTKDKIEPDEHYLRVMKPIEEKLGLSPTGQMKPVQVEAPVQPRSAKEMSIAALMGGGWLVIVGFAVWAMSK